MSEITITEPMLTSREAEPMLDIMRWGQEFDTPNGEMPDALARTIAGWYQSSGSVGSVLASLASGCPVDRDALSDDIANTARPLGWPTELEYLATWVPNHD